MNRAPRPYRLETLSVIPMASLGNKMLAIASAKRLCALAGARCTVVWEWGDYRAIFADRDVSAIAPEDFEPPSDAHYVRHALRAEGGHIANRRVPLTRDRHVVAMSWFVFNGEEEPALAHEDDLDLRPWLPAPVAAVARRAREFRRRHFAENVVGIHVRRTDNVLAARRTPDDLYFHEADRLVAEGCHLFLATDNHATERTFRARYPGRVVTFPKRPDLAERMPRPFRLEDTLDDWIDLCLLGSCAFVLGSAYSSFSKVARLLNGSPRSRLLETPGVLA